MAAQPHVASSNQGADWPGRLRLLRRACRRRFEALMEVAREPCVLAVATEAPSWMRFDRHELPCALQIVTVAVMATESVVGRPDSLASRAREA